MTRHTLHRSMAAALLALGAAGAAGAQESAPDTVSLCLDCHQPAQRQGQVPLIAGQHAPYLRVQLERFREHHREGFPMTAFAQGFTAAELDALARRIAAEPWQSHPAPAADARQQAKGRRRTQALACESCHGDTYVGGDEIPRLAGQHPGYLVRQILSFAEDGRYHPPFGTGARARGLSKGDAEAMAAYLHALGATPATP